MFSVTFKNFLSNIRLKYQTMAAHFLLLAAIYCIMSENVILCEKIPISPSMLASESPGCCPYNTLHVTN